MLFGRLKKQNNIHFIVDAGSASVSACFCYKKANAEKPTIFWYKKQKLDFESDDSRKISRKNALKIALEKIIEDAHNYAYKEKIHKSISKSYITFSAPWFLSVTKKEKIKHSKPTLFTHIDLSKIIKEAGDELEENAKNSTKEIDNYLKNGATVIEKHLINIKINGYQVNNPFDKMANEIELHFFLSILPSDLVSFVNGLFRTRLFDTEVTIRSFPLMHFLAAGEIKEDLGNVVFIDISGGATEIVKIEDGTLVSSDQTFIGKDDFRKAIEKNYNLKPFMAESLLDTFTQNLSNEKESMNIKFTLKDTEEEWKIRISEHIENLKQSGYLCFNFVLSSDSESEKYFKKLLLDLIKGFEGDCFNVSTLGTYTEMIKSNNKKVDPFVSMEAIASYGN